MSGQVETLDIVNAIAYSVKMFNIHEKFLLS